MLNVEKLMSLTEMAQGQADGLSAADNIYSNISLDEAVMVGQVQLLESTIEFHNIMDEDDNSNMDIFINQIHIRQDIIVYIYINIYVIRIQ